MRLDIYSDTICPWCFIGKRRLDRALAERPQSGLTIHWRAFQLNPEMLAEGMDRQLYLQLKFGGAENAERVYAQVRSAGEDEEIPFAFDAMQRTPNTVDSHRLIRFAADKGLQNEVVEALFEAYFLRGEDIGQRDVLAAAAAGAGLDAGETRAFLDSDLEEQAVHTEDQEARQAGLQGVPTFIVNGKYALSGAHEPEVLCQMFDIGRGDEMAGSASETAGMDGPGETG
jgi:predicted DsbA family dithiol-disulfide isomerase